MNYNTHKFVYEIHTAPSSNLRVNLIPLICFNFRKFRIFILSSFNSRFFRV